MDILSYKIKLENKDFVECKWYVIDVEGEVVGCFCICIVIVFCGKYKVFYILYFDVGDYVIVINVDKVRFIGVKWD